MGQLYLRRKGEIVEGLGRDDDDKMGYGKKR